MDGYLSKPIRSRELSAALEGLLSSPCPGTPGEGRGGGPNAESISLNAAPFDPVAARDRAGGDTKLLAELIQIFLENAGPNLAEIHAAIANDDASRLNRAAHKLKGSVSVFGAASTVQLLQSLEEMSESHDLCGAPAITARLESELERLESALKSIIQENRYENSDCRR
jgi:HPt (histidine-containing phosphotransfer) domain-containing protein